MIANLFFGDGTTIIVDNVGASWLLTTAGLSQGRQASKIFNLLHLDPLHSIIILPILF